MLLMAKPKRPKNKYQKMVHKFVKEECINWGREVKLSVELYSYCPEEEFWQNLYLGFQLKSLAWFKSKNGGESLLRREYTLFKLTQKQGKEYTIDENFQLSLEVREKKIKNIIDFIDNKNE